MVARDGIEPPTPAFSGLRSTPELPGHILTYADSVGGPGEKSFNLFKGSMPVCSWHKETTLKPNEL